MYRFLSRTVCVGRNASLSVYESCVLSLKCNTVFRPVNGGRETYLSTCPVKLCEKKDDPIPSTKGETTKEDCQIKIKVKKEEAVVLNADNEGPKKQVEHVTVKEVATKSTDVKTGVAKSGKEGLLDLLGAMKVEVTTKRKLKNLKTKQSLESTTHYKHKPEALEKTSSMFQKATLEVSSQSDTLDPDLVAAASAAASTLPNQRQAESELLRQLRQRKALSEAQKKGNMDNLGVIIAHMKVGKNPSRQNAWPADQIRFDDDGRGYTQDRGITAELAGVRRRRNLIPAKKLNIFSPSTGEDRVEPTLEKPTLWDVDFANRLTLSTNQMPRNGFEEMIQWTKEGKLWQYPVNNEIGLEEEACVPFHEHVFLEKHLEEGFPRQGPVRHFMELVVAGLSKNPFLTVQQKKEHIFWFRDYFHQKERILNEADVYLN